MKPPGYVSPANTTEKYCWDREVNNDTFQQDKLVISHDSSGNYVPTLYSS